MTAKITRFIATPEALPWRAGTLQEKADERFAELERGAWLRRDVEATPPGLSFTPFVVQSIRNGGCSNGYCFEARFRMARPITQEKLEQEFQDPKFKRPLELFRPHGMNTLDGWLAVKSCGYADNAEAKTSGALFHDGLLIVAAKQPVGVEFYRRVGPDGIHVYSGQMQLSDPELPMPTPQTHDNLKEMMAAAVESAASLTANRRIAAELLNDSLFNMSPEASFLLRVSAVEALCPQANQTDAFKAIVDGVRMSIPEDASPSDRDQIERALKTLAERQSVRSAYLAKIKSLIGNDQAKKFDGFYGQRSKLLHEGTRPRDIG